MGHPASYNPTHRDEAAMNGAPVIFQEVVHSN